ncbi:MAG TPA: acyltransferase [Aliidongia sp.]|uniref:acyltransferase n=1 Tax=Aliidongia sp. TaxID=1914230 RepID=UPI002DDD82D6|nr:acyltransferase [Aliidongia sp.]HEV2674623.1 acyltransferase [Aliidongia sp.]
MKDTFEPVRKILLSCLPERAITFLRRSRGLIDVWRYGRKHVSSTAFVDKNVHVLGWRNVAIGEDAILSEGCWLNVNHRDRDVRQIAIGRRSYIGRRNFFSSGLLIEFKDYTMTSVNCCFLGSNHFFENPFTPYIFAGVRDDAVISLGVNCQLGAGVTIIGNVKIGHGCIIGAASLVNKDVPPFSIAVGNPARVIKRYDMEAQAWIPADQFTAEKERLIPDEEAYLATLDAAIVFPGMPLHAAGKSMGDLP